MEERLNDRICREVFEEFYIRKNYEESIKKSKKVFRLLMKNDYISAKDNYYIWMILIVIVKSYYRINLIDKSLKYILITLRYSDCDWMRIESMKYLMKYYRKKNELNDINDKVILCRRE